MRTMCSREIFTKKYRQQQIFDSDLKGAWHYNHMTFTPIAKNFMLYCRLIYTLSILCVRLTMKVKVGIPESFKVGWWGPPPPPHKKKKKMHGSSYLKTSKPNFVTFFVYFGNSLFDYLRNFFACYGNKPGSHFGRNFREFGVALQEELEVNQ